MFKRFYLVQVQHNAYNIFTIFVVNNDSLKLEIKYQHLIYIFDSYLVWRMQLNIIKVEKFVKLMLIKG